LYSPPEVLTCIGVVPEMPEALSGIVTNAGQMRSMRALHRQLPPKDRRTGHCRLSGRRFQPRRLHILRRLGGELHAGMFRPPRAGTNTGSLFAFELYLSHRHRATSIPGPQDQRSEAFDRRIHRA